ncbi:hypothetical protein AABB02_10545 [Streptomyces rimosus]|uniref:hypothetical protein n=1 Tax=Streptomyces rimosus TaxID=1927 RepID=UPI0031D6F9DE
MSGVGHAAPPGTAAHVPLPLALGMPDRNSWLILIGFLVALVLILWLIGRAVRKQGGFRRACRRIAWEARMTARAFTAPLRAYLRHRRCARTLAAYFADPAAYDTARAALDRADADTGDGCYAPAVQLAQTRDRVRVVIAGRDPAGAAGPVLPWTDAAGEPGEWTWSAPADAVRGPAGHGRAVRLPLVLGVDRKVPGVVLVDWLRGPAALGVEGDPQVSRSVLQALAAQVDRMPDGPPVLITAGVHPRFPGRALDDVLAELAAGVFGRGPAAGPDAQAPDPTAVPVVVCWAPTPEQAARLADLCARGRARALVGGRLPGACWVLHAEPDGRVLGPGPRVDVESPALGPAVARAVRRRQAAPHCVLPGAGMAAGTVPAGQPAQPDLHKSEAASVRHAEPVQDPRQSVPASVRHAEPAPGPRQPEPFAAAQPSPDFAEPGRSPDLAEPRPAPDSAEPVREPAAAVRPSEPGPAAPPQPLRKDSAPRESAALNADFAEPEPEPEPGAGASAPAPAQPPAAPAPRQAEASPAPGSGTAPGADFAEPDFAEPDLAEPGSAAAPPGLAGVSAAGTSEADSDPAATGDPQERTPRTP